MGGEAFWCHKFMGPLPRNTSFKTQLVSVANHVLMCDTQPSDSIEFDCEIPTTKIILMKMSLSQTIIISTSSVA